MIFIRYPFRCKQQLLDFENVPVSADLVKDKVESYLGVNEFSLLYNGRKLHGMEIIPHNSTVHVVFSLPGGKGGFGSMLRAIGAQIEKTTNREACRDLSGRRLRDINEEQRLKKWIAKEAEREAEKVKRRQARIERLKNKAPHNFFDYEYEKKISELPDRINEALSEGLQKAKQPKKRPHEKSEGSVLSKKWLADDLPLTSSESDSDDTNTVGESSCSKKPKMAPSYNSDIPESSEPQPCSSKDCVMEESSSNDTSSTFTYSKSEESSSDSDKGNLIQQENKQPSEEESAAPSSEVNNIPSKESKKDSSAEEITQGNKGTEKCDESLVSNKSIPIEQPEVQDNSPINLLDFESVSDLEALGLDRLKLTLMSHGLKCGGTLSDRAQRLWKIRGLQPHEYPTNLMVKSKK